MSEKKSVRLSVLDLAPVPQGSRPHDAFNTSLALARQSEQLGYHRYWLAEHHNMTGIASAATSVLIGYLAANTKHLRLGSGGIMLPNHAPLVIAEQFGTLATLYPDRIDLGVGRAPGSDQRTMMALRRHLSSAQADTFPDDVAELIRWFDHQESEAPLVQPVPGLGINIPLWLLGSSLYSAQLAAKMGLPFAFASHFAPEQLMHALHLYREEFQPSARLDKPYAMACVNVIAADSVQEARYLFTSQQQQFINLRRGKPGPLPAPVENMDNIWSPSEQYGVQQALSMSLVGDVEKVRQGLATLRRETLVDEIMVNGQIFSPEARLHSYALAMEAADGL
ncbi:luciferase-like monooxygenase [Candidatus Pantoea multigeneris]|uniref:Luciferase-like monooxygenase n=1 Tax=Candidatus Pantoea multigeneris TaxID=2608357 RepID=A0ABX0RB61_9GAMM|nr:luciferase-like monooxygenase [Pantoea multigeneris]NIF22595.1 luciferase-like monooxygenase [Pantoea multigeneris]